MRKKIMVGIDEVGRGPVAGPVSVGIAVLWSGNVPPGTLDSKEMSEKAREAVYGLAREMHEAGELTFGVYSESAAYIDAEGIEAALKRAIGKGIRDLGLDPSEVELKLDGRLVAPREYAQETIIRGDALVPAISLASVVAKVTRDRYMGTEAHTRYPRYGFDAHKGYGTPAHLERILRYGCTPLHRRSFLRKVVLASPHVRRSKPAGRTAPDASDPIRTRRAS